MAKKRVCFFETKLYDECGAQVSQKAFKEIIVSILENEGVDQVDHVSIDITPYDEVMHLIFDGYDYKDGRLFGRFSKQLPKNTLVQHEYATYADSEVLPGVNEKDSGIEKYTYGMLNYNSGILAFIAARGASNEKALKMLIEKYELGYTLEIIPIPNERGIENIYSGKEPEISKLEIEVPLPDTEVLEKLFGWSDEKLLESLGENNLKVTTVLKAEPRHSIAEEPGVVKKIIDAVKEGKESYNKAKMLAKAKTIKAREYNFFDDNFTYPIDVASYHVQQNERVYYSTNELVDIFRQNMNISFSDSRGILDLFGNDK